MRAAHSAGPRPSRSITPGRLPSISASAPRDQPQRLLDRLRTLEVERDDALAAPQRVLASGRFGIADRRLVGPDDRGDLGAMIGEHAAGQGPGADALELDDGQAGERTQH